MGTNSEPPCQTGFCWYLSNPATTRTITQATLDKLKYTSADGTVLAANNRSNNLGGKPVFIYRNTGLLYPTTPTNNDEL